MAPLPLVVPNQPADTGVASYAAGGVAGGDGAAAAVVPNQPADNGVAAAYAAGGVAGDDGAAAVVPNQPADIVVPNQLTLPVA